MTHGIIIEEAGMLVVKRGERAEKAVCNWARLHYYLNAWRWKGRSEAWNITISLWNHDDSANKCCCYVFASEFQAALNNNNINKDFEDW